MPHWQTVNRDIQEKRLKTLKKCLNALAPEYLRKLSQFTRDTHLYGLRSSTLNDLFLKDGNTEYCKRKFSFWAAKD